MKLSVIAPDNVYQHEIDASVEVQDIHALLEADVGSIESSQLTRQAGIPSTGFVLVTDAGVMLTDPRRTLASYGLISDSSLFLEPK